MPMDKIPLFQGCGTALVTPMRPRREPDGVPEVDFEAFTKLIRAQIDGGADALIVCGTTGESPTLTDEEKRALFSLSLHEVRAALRDGRLKTRIPVIAGTGSNNTARAVALSRMAQAVGCDGLLVVTPYYNKANGEGLEAHYRAVAGAVDLPLILYHVPSRTGCRIPAEVCRRLSECPQVVGLKEASGDLSYASRVAALCGDSLPLYAGNDDVTLPILALGGVGVISVVSNLLPERMSALCRAWREGRISDARKEQYDLLPLCDALFSDVNPIPVKAAMEMTGACPGGIRLPLTQADGRVRERLAALLPRYGLKS